MRISDKIFVISGLVLLAGPFGCTATAQDYVDLEAERAAAAQTTAPGDPYAPRGAQSYPATSYGVGTAPAAPAVAAATPAASVPSSQPVAPQLSGQDQSQNLGMLFMQIQQLQQQVMQLNGRVEEQANELRTLREQSLQRYVDLDKRLSAAGAGGAAVAAPGAAQAPADGDAILAVGPSVAGSAPGAAQPGEDEAYRAAYSLVQSQKFDQAVQAFQKFQRDYPAGKYAPNTYYWLGELYLVIQPPDLESSRQSFAMLLSQYPDNSKAPDALYKLGKVQYMKGNREKAKEYLDQVISRYGSTNSSAVKLARDFLAENY
ncbi:MAG: tol-pal system protein YbgF [Halieaceae bacterium]|jgi:tol-pal system protein YbgF|nr:tol-pal system protein YbgF [Halieaceae bacterium]